MKREKTEKIECEKRERTRTKLHKHGKKSKAVKNLYTKI